MSNVIDDYDYENNLLPQGGPEPIEGKIKKNIQRWVLISVLLIATPIAVWQGLREEKTGVENWKIKEQERTAGQARAGQASAESVKQIAILATEQKQAASAASAPSSAVPASSELVPDGPLPYRPSAGQEELPVAPSFKVKPGAQGLSDRDKSQRDIDTQIAASNIILLSGGAGKLKAASEKQLASSLPAGMFLPNGQASPSLSSADMINAMKPQAPSSRTEAARQWIKEQQTTKTDSAGIYSRPAHIDMVVIEGTLLDAALLTAVNTDLPGDVTAIITRDVYDSVQPEKYLLIPKGSKLIGSYNSEVNVAQERVMMAFQRLIFPDGSSINLLGMSGTDPIGVSGMKGDVDNHFIKMFGASFMIAGISNLVSPSQPANVNVYGSGGGQLTTETGAILSDISSRILRRNESIPPTITIPAGERFNVRVNKDMHLPPYVVLRRQ